MVQASASAQVFGTLGFQKGTVEAIGGMDRASLEFARSRPLLRFLLARDARLVLASYGDVVERGTDEWRQQIASLLEVGVASGEIRSDLAVQHIATIIAQLHLAYADRELTEADIECVLHEMSTAPSGQRAK